MTFYFIIPDLINAVNQRQHMVAMSPSPNTVISNINNSYNLTVAPLKVQQSQPAANNYIQSGQYGYPQPNYNTPSTFPTDLKQEYLQSKEYRTFNQEIQQKGPAEDYTFCEPMKYSPAPNYAQRERHHSYSREQRDQSGGNVDQGNEINNMEMSVHIKREESH